MKDDQFLYFWLVMFMVLLGALFSIKIGTSKGLIDFKTGIIITISLIILWTIIFYPHIKKKQQLMDDMEKKKYDKMYEGKYIIKLKEKSKSKRKIG